MGPRLGPRFRVKLDWVHGVNSVRASILYGEVYIRQAKDGNWEIEINGELLKARPKYKDVAMEHAADMIRIACLYWLEEMTNAKEYFSPAGKD